MSVRNPHQLLLSKQLFEDARLYAEREDSFSHTKAVVLLDLAIEVLLHNIVLNFDPDLTVNASNSGRDTDRRTLWGNTSQALKSKGKQLAELREMASLHTLRNLVQHNGTEPTRTEVLRYLSSAERVLVGAFRDAYELDFVNFRLWDVIANEDLQLLLRESEHALGKDRPEICIVGCKYAHELVVSAIRKTTKLHRTRISSIFTRSGSGHGAMPLGLPSVITSQVQSAARQLDREIKNAEARLRREIIKELDFIEDELVSVGVGMPLLETRKFQWLGNAIHYFRAESGDLEVRITKDIEPSESTKAAQFMLNYILRLIRLIDESYPEVLRDIKVSIKLSEQKFWGKVEGPNP
jgi:hypothetical protein